MSRDTCRPFERWRNSRRPSASANRDTVAPNASIKRPIVRTMTIDRECEPTIRIPKCAKYAVRRSAVARFASVRARSSLRSAYRRAPGSVEASSIARATSSSPPAFGRSQTVSRISVSDASSRAHGSWPATACGTCRELRLVRQQPRARSLMLRGLREDEPAALRMRAPLCRANGRC